ncbi:MAG: PKD domain-containing protein [Firmicutes bacterium]|nr:PKD domain-containing protein [Bacillota bacterium]
MNLKKTIILGLFLLLLSQTVVIQYGMASGYTQVFYCTKDASAKVEEYNETKTFTIPEEPLTFTTNINWRAEVDERHLVENEKPYCKIFIVDRNGVSREEVKVGEGKKQSGTIRLQPGQFCKFTLYSGKYKSVIGTKHAAEVKASCNYQTLQVTAMELATAGVFKLSVAGPEGYNWIWTIPGLSEISGNTIQSTFKPGDTRITVADEGLKHALNFKLPIPEVVELDPIISGTNGYEEFMVKVTTKLENHYQSTSECTWDPGDGSPIMNGVNYEHTYKKTGAYQLKLKVKNSLGPIIEKSWNITVKPFKITIEPYINPDKGVMPLKVRYESKSKVYGQPFKLKYFWDFGDGATSTTESGEHLYVKPGEYRITLSLMDELHPELKPLSWSGMITVSKPVLTLAPSAKQQSGTIPFQVQFNPNLKIEGSPTKIEYLWDFGDGTTSIEKAPKHTFSEPGRYKVNLTVYDRLNETEVSELIAIDALPPLLTSKSNLSPLSGSMPLIVEGKAIPEISGYPTKLVYNWYVNDKLVYTGENFKYTFKTPGAYTVILRIRDDLPGHIAQASHTWNVIVNNPAPQ